MPVSADLTRPDVQLPPSSADFATTITGRVRNLIERGQFNAAALLLPTLGKLGVAPEAVAALSADIALGRGDVSLATATVDKHIELIPDSAVLLMLRARICRAGGDRVGAAVAAADAIMVDPSNAPAKSLLGQVLLELGQVDQAAICLIEAIGTMFDDEPTLAALIRAAPQAAVVAIRNALAQGRGGSSIRNKLIGVLLATGELEAARQEIAALTSSGGADGETGLLAVQVALADHSWVEARSLFQQSTSHLPRHA